MRTAAALVAACMAQPALAQWGVFGFSKDGMVYEIDEFTGEMALVGDVGLAIVDAEEERSVHSSYYYYNNNYYPQEVVVLTEDDRLVRVNLRNLETTDLGQLAGRPSGYLSVAYSGDWAVLRSPAGDDILYGIDESEMKYKEIGPTGLSDVTGMSSRSICTASGGLYEFNDTTSMASLVKSVNNGDPINAIARAGCNQVVTGNGLYQFNVNGTQPLQISPNSFEEITALTHSSSYLYACTMDTGTGPSVCDIFDFLQFQDYFVRADSRACDCDTSTGPGVCDTFDFLCFQNAFTFSRRSVLPCR